MSFTVELCYNRNEHNKIKKAISTVYSLEGNLRDECSIVDPVILIEHAGALTGVNYSHIATFNRYYFITNIESVRTGLWRVHMHCDVLMTYADAILSTPAIIAKNETNWDPYLDDGQYRAAANPYIVTLPFPHGFGEGSHAHQFILALAGNSIDYNP